MFPKFHLKSPKLSPFLGAGRGLGKTTLSFSKDVTIRLGQGGIKGKTDNVYDAAEFGSAYYLVLTNISLPVKKPFC